MGDAQSCGAKFVRLDSATLNDESDEEQLIEQIKFGNTMNKRKKIREREREKSAFDWSGGEK
ncbi:hypothetical protein BpHYR1_020582 [Brachionus plicatilis]|uniref:Uncharacterized protein n=1 Tax=Brachionus plicatilis TaxID=10195 RepID=A0A3M7PJG9_BRAPC|nr:hypothetical protein BpHYR1_020582 [Brachionus plicatilis]